MNAGIITIYGLNNYGNRLQNYAVFSTLLKLGVDSDSLIPMQWTKTPFRKALELKIKYLIKTNPMEAQESNPQVVRSLRYEAFNEEYIPERYFDILQFNEQIAKEYDFFVTGSDQVWNPNFRDSLGQLENRLLAFARPEQRVCFAPSIGIDELDKKYHLLFHKEWNKYSFLNIREQSGADIIKEITGRTADVVLDPTFMVDKEEWLSLEKPLPGFDETEPYILYYFLGNEEHEVSVETRFYLDKIMIEKGMKEYRLLDKNNPIVCSAGPSEFLYLLHHASLICTDSFHGTVFSILLGKPFILVDRKLMIADKEIDMSNRTISLLKKLRLTHKLPGVRELTEENIWEADYSEAYEIISKEKVRMNNILKRIMRLE